jgi:hypothetical protein
MCNTVNDSAAESCTYCGYIFEDVAAKKSLSSPNGVSEAAPTNVVQNNPAPANRSFASTPTENNPSSAVFVVKSSWKDRRNIPSIIIAVLVILFYVASYVPAIESSSLSPVSLIFLVIPFVFILPLITNNKTFEFYDSYLSISGLGSHQTIPYSEIISVNNYRGRILIQLKNTWRQVRVQGTVVSNSTGQDLVAWLNQKIKKEPEEGSDKVSAEN